MQFSWAQKPFAVAAAGLLLIVLWSAATVHVNYRNQWSGLFCIGQAFPPPPPLRANSYIFPHSSGFDGQFYRDIAHDPFNHRGFGQYIDDAHYRYRRILLPLLANLLGLGQDGWIDGAYIAIEWLSALLGAYWIARFAQLNGRTAWWGLVYYVLPPTLISLDRMLTDLPFTTLCVGFFYFAYREKFQGMLVTATLACLTRETGVFLVAGYAVYLLWQRDVRRAIVFSGAIIPFAVWALIESRLTEGKSLPFTCCSYPGSSIISALRTPYPYALPAAISRTIQTFDILSLLGMVACSILLWYAARKGTAGMAAAVWTCSGVVLAGMVISCIPGSFNHVYDYGRQYSPVLVVLVLAAIEERKAILLVPIAFMTLRVAIQMLPQASAIVRSI